MSNLVNENSDPFQESIDDPNLPFDIRWRLLTELDILNHRLGVYKKIIQEWETFYKKAGSPKKFSLLEIGSGAGGLANSIYSWGKSKKIEIDIHLIDSQLEALVESQKKFEGTKPSLHLDTDQHLQVFKNDEFDFIISLHVIHHIQPIHNAAMALNEIARISKLGFLVFDYDQRFYSVLMSKVSNSLFGQSKLLAKDGIKSLKRAYDSKIIKSHLNQNQNIKKFNWNVSPYFFWPYWKIEALIKR